MEGISDSAGILQEGMTSGHSSAGEESDKRSCVQAFVVQLSALADHMPLNALAGLAGKGERLGAGH